MSKEPSAQISYWVTSGSDVAVRKWIDSNLLDRAVPYAKSQGAHVIRVRFDAEEDARRTALASANFEAVDDIEIMLASIPRHPERLPAPPQPAEPVTFERVEPGAIIALHNLAYAGDDDVVRLTKKRASRLAPSNAETWLAKAGNTQVGFVELSSGAVSPSLEELEPLGRLDSIAVLPAFRGQGLGHLLSHFALRRFAELGLRHGALQVRASNAPALKIYRRLGFRPVARQALWQRRLVPVKS